MMELKIICQCGQKYKFDVEPVNGKMPFSVKCPICNLDGTTTANTLLAHRLAAPPMHAQVQSGSPQAPAIHAAAPPPPRPVSAPPPVPIQATPPPPPPAPAGGLKFNRDMHAAPVPIAPPVGPVNGDNTPPALGSMRPFAVSAAANPPKPTSFGRGVLGAFIGALVGSVIYYLVLHFSGLMGFFGLRLLAIGVGALAGWLADIMGKGEGSKELGGIAAVLVLGGVVGAQYFVAMGWWHEVRDAALKDAQAAYANAVVEAKEAVQAVPTGSDAEIRQYLAKSESDDDNKVTPATVSDDEAKDFRDNQLPEYLDLASGKLGKTEYDTKHEIKTSETKEEEDSQDNSVKGLFLLLLLSRSNLFAMAGAAALAFKLSVNN